MLVYIDCDDKKSIEAAPKLEQQFPFVKFLQGASPENLSRDCYNPLAQFSTGRFVLILNDDVVFLTPQWDRICLETLTDFQAKHQDGIVLGKTRCDTGNFEYSCFPVISREAINFLGYLQPPSFGGWAADIALHKIYSSVQREIDLDIDLSHRCIHNRKRGRDRVSQRMSRLSKYPWQDLEKDIGRLKNLLREP
ncbi:unnamed protein product [Gemmata massiliana]|uniref:Glycosyltransferase 2-like domain-containing protein n=1 Tax=Gemmata massiliana TaxID=1210884 RepID=A0A6P2CYN3_9BACT|nr:unnamed protein product [Gemmata massiliana]